MGPPLLPPIVSGDPSGVWMGGGPERGRGQGMPKKTPAPQAVERGMAGKGPRAHVFRGAIRPVTNSSRSLSLFHYTSPLYDSNRSH